MSYSSLFGDELALIMRITDMFDYGVGDGDMRAAISEERCSPIGRLWRRLPKIKITANNRTNLLGDRLLDYAFVNFGHASNAHQGDPHLGNGNCLIRKERRNVPSLAPTASNAERKHSVASKVYKSQDRLCPTVSITSRSMLATANAKTVF